MVCNFIDSLWYIFWACRKFSIKGQWHEVRIQIKRIPLRLFDSLPMMMGQSHFLPSNALGRCIEGFHQDQKICSRIFQKIPSRIFGFQRRHGTLRQILFQTLRRWIQWNKYISIFNIEIDNYLKKLSSSKKCVKIVFIIKKKRTQKLEKQFLNAFSS